MDEKTMDSWNIFAKTGSIQDYLNYKQLENQLSAQGQEKDSQPSSTSDIIQEFY